MRGKNKMRAWLGEWNAAVRGAADLVAAEVAHRELRGLRENFDILTNVTVPVPPGVKSLNRESLRQAFREDVAAEVTRRLEIMGTDARVE